MIWVYVLEFTTREHRREQVSQESTGGDQRQWQSYERDVEWLLETDTFDLDDALGARLLLRLTGSAEHFAYTVALQDVRCSVETTRK